MNDGRKTSKAWRIGAIMQGLVLGVLVSVAIVELWTRADDVRLFRYQNF